MIAEPQLVDRLNIAVAELNARLGSLSSGMDLEFGQKWRTWLGGSAVDGHRRIG